MCSFCVAAFAAAAAATNAREHFTVNIAVAGGLLLISQVGGGRFAVDELLKKKD